MAWHNTQRRKTYQSWQDMRQRCSNPRNHNYKNYGARGISVCDRWESFYRFVDDMGLKPDFLTIDRKNNNGNYEPNNCRWATRSEQRRNQRGNVMITKDDRTMTIEEWAMELQIHPETIRSRRRNGWPQERWLIRPDPAFSPSNKSAMSSDKKGAREP